jgi:hypothetical protein
MESEFLRAMNYRLTVEKREYEIWRRMVEGFVSARIHRPAILPWRGAILASHAPYIHPATAYIPSTPYLVTPPEVRARSTSPNVHPPHHPGPYVTPDHSCARKRSAANAFEGESSSSDQLYHSWPWTNRTPGQAIRTPGGQLPSVLQPTSSGSARLLSHDRQIAGVGSSRRGSGGSAASAQVNTSYGAIGEGSRRDLRHVATDRATQWSHSWIPGTRPGSEHWEWLVAPYSEQPRAHPIPPNVSTADFHALKSRTCL